MATRPAQLTRLRPDEVTKIREVRNVREAARTLRSRVSLGSYGDDELRQFWGLCESAESILGVSNAELGARAGLGSEFFVSVARDRRRAKLPNFLKALTVIFEVANERLYAVERVGVETVRATEKSSAVATKDLPDLLLLATSLARMARDEIGRIDNEIPNDPVVVGRNEKQRELLEMLASGFDQIADALIMGADQVSKRNFQNSLSDVVKSVGNEVNSWWKKNGADAVDWSVRIPVFAAGVGMLGLAGASMPIATTAVAAMVGGPKVLRAIKALKKPR